MWLIHVWQVESQIILSQQKGFEHKSGDLSLKMPSQVIKVLVVTSLV